MQMYNVPMGSHNEFAWGDGTRFHSSAATADDAYKNRLTTGLNCGYVNCTPNTEFKEPIKPEPGLYKAKWNDSVGRGIVFAVLRDNGQWSYVYDNMDELRTKWDTGSHPFSELSPIKRLGPWPEKKTQEHKPGLYKCHWAYQPAYEVRYGVLLENGMWSYVFTTLEKLRKEWTHGSHVFDQIKAIERLGPWPEPTVEIKVEVKVLPEKRMPGMHFVLNTYYTWFDGETFWNGKTNPEGAYECYQKHIPEESKAIRLLTADGEKMVRVDWTPPKESKMDKRAPGMYKVIGFTGTWYTWFDGAEFWNSRSKLEDAYEQYQERTREKHAPLAHKMSIGEVERVDWTPQVQATPVDVIPTPVKEPTWRSEKPPHAGVYLRRAAGSKYHSKWDGKAWYMGFVSSSPDSIKKASRSTSPSYKQDGEYQLPCLLDLRATVQSPSPAAGVLKSRRSPVDRRVLLL